MIISNKSIQDIQDRLQNVENKIIKAKEKNNIRVKDYLEGKEFAFKKVLLLIEKDN